jgi:hypothetical protein
MKRFVQGDNRTQSFLLPEALDDYVTDTNPVRVVDIFVVELDLQKLGFEGVEPALTGRPSYHPEVILKIYVDQLATDASQDATRGLSLAHAPGQVTLDRFTRRQATYQARSAASESASGKPSDVGAESEADVRCVFMKPSLARKHSPKDKKTYRNSTETAPYCNIDATV